MRHRVVSVVLVGTRDSSHRFGQESYGCWAQEGMLVDCQTRGKHGDVPVPGDEMLCSLASHPLCFALSEVNL